MRLYLVNPGNPIVSLSKVRSNRLNRYRVMSFPVPARVATVRISLEIDFYKMEASMSGWIDKLKQKEAARKRQRETDQETQNRKARIVSAKARPLWEAVIAQVKADVAELREAFPDDPAKDFEFVESEAGFAVTRNGFPHASLSASWVEDICGVEIYFKEQRSMYATQEEKREEIDFQWAAEDSVKMTLDERSHMLASSLSEQLLRKLIEFA